MTRIRQVAALLAAAVTAACLFAMGSSMSVQPYASGVEFVSVARHPRMHADRENARVPNHAMAPSVHTAPLPVIAPDYAAQFALASDYFDFARMVLPAAQAGDHDAQFYLFQALRYCDEEYRSYFFTGSRERSLSEGIEWASSNPSASIDAAGLIHLRCNSLAHNRDEALSSADDWLRRSTDGGHPRAQTVSAEELLLDAALAARGSAFSSFGPGLAAVHTEAARELLRTAALSRDPAILWTIADLLPAIANDANAVAARQWVWRLAACQRSNDCGLQASWYEFGCRFYAACQQGDSGGELIRRAVGEEFPEIERRARELNAQLDAGTLDATDLD